MYMYCAKISWSVCDVGKYKTCLGLCQSVLIPVVNFKNCAKVAVSSESMLSEWKIIIIKQ